MDLMTNRYEEQAKIVTLSRAYLMDIYDAFKDNITVFVTLIDGEVVTGLIDLQYRDTLFAGLEIPNHNYGFTFTD